MKQVTLLGLAAAFLVFSVSCGESGQPTGEAKKETGAGKEAIAPGGAETALVAPPGTPGRMENDEGVGHYKQDHWDVAEVHFRKSVEADPGLAIAHFNLALSLDKLGKHGEASQHFKKALELAPDDPQIAQSEILKAHVGM